MRVDAKKKKAYELTDDAKGLIKHATEHGGNPRTHPSTVPASVAQLFAHQMQLDPKAFEIDLPAPCNVTAAIDVETFCNGSFANPSNQMFGFAAAGT